MFSLFRHLEEAPADRESSVLAWEPRNDTIVVLPLIAADRTASGLYLPDDTRERPQMGVVLAIGAGMFDPERLRVLPVEARAGDLVIYGKYSGSTFEIAENVHVLMMRNVEFLARKPWAEYGATLVEHLIEEATTKERLVYHLPGALCEYCGKDTRDAAYRRALHGETADERAARWERVHVERGRAAAEQARQAAALAEAVAATAPSPIDDDDAPTTDAPSLIALERERLRRLREATDQAVGEGLL